MNNATLCIDVAKNKSVARAFLPGNHPFCKPFTFNHTQTDIAKTSELLDELKSKAGSTPDIVLEATGSYSKPLVRHFYSSGYNVVQLNPLQTGLQKRRSLRKIKTDPIDTSRIASVYYLEDCALYDPLGDKFEELRTFAWHYYSINESYTEILQKYLSILDVIFPNFNTVFYSSYSKTSLVLLDTYPSIPDILNAPKDDIISILKLSRRSLDWCEDKYLLLIAAAKEALYDDSSQLSQSFVLKTYISLIRHFNKAMVDIRDQLINTAKQTPYYALLISIPGIGQITAATILAEIGDINRFSSSKKLVAFAGLDPSVHQSGNYVARKNSISKRGTPYLRKALYQATCAAICKRKTGAVNKSLYEYYTRKVKDGKPSKVAIIATSHKLLRIIYSMLKNQESFNEQ